ncbi:DUF4350 domain-containing protein [Microbacterium sp. zg.Y1090]|uniref:DUF4350 domain-containing protein n=1 Tax=Microbacterium wangruii TaxID=3049073 RepID=UPI00214D1042|nr:MULTISPECIES: DUF4350 domain-containing protein [unclassified Microbacterium]MCR2818100.1 DUF4350 domain-containing protein [Microbacterium sp. zg.Y1090]WIM27744.1 DUF4350 domain-containing protein [Microbacterium sp. zg-Y1090]
MTSTTDAPASATRRRAGAWALIAAAILAIGAGSAAMLAAGEWTERDALDPASVGPTGTRALAEVLRGQGVEVTVARDRTTAERALAAGGATLVITDTAPLDDATLRDIAGAAADVVLVDPRSRDLRLLLGAQSAGVGDGADAEPGCALPDAERSGTIVPGAVFTAPSGVTACYPSGDGYGLLLAETDAGRIVALDARELFSNAGLAEDGNAALAAHLLGRNDEVVWYLPALGDGALPDTAPSLGELTPDWVTPAIVVLLASASAAMLWRGRRFGPLVAETLPVTVRASETTEGRARLYARARDAVHAADQLRMGTLDRLARTLGLGPAAAAPEIADAAAARLGIDRARVRGILMDDLPADDGELVALADALENLETAVRDAVRPERNPQ